jgi:N-acetylglucosamine kinase-like BadF-type ATPase
MKKKAENNGIVSRGFVFGADGGGTKTIGLLANMDGLVLSRIQVGGSNQNVVGPREAAARLADVILQCSRQAGVDPGMIRAAVLGLAGAGGTQERKNLVVAIQSLLAAEDVLPLPIVVQSDSYIALEGAFGGGPGVAVVAGTGSAVIGKTPEGTLLQIGGWGRVLGDEGSGYAIGLQALRLLTQELDGLGEASRLRDALGATFGLTTRERLIEAVYREELDIPSIAPLVLKSAAEADAGALTILTKASRELARQVVATIRLLGFRGTTGVAFIGGLIDQETIYARMLRQAIVSQWPHAVIQPPLHSPAHGAVSMALSQAREREKELRSQ